MTQRYTDNELMVWRSAKNVGAVTIGAREICKVCTGGDDLRRSMIAVSQPDGTAGKSYCVNSALPIPPGETGRVCFGPVVLVAYDTGTPAVDAAYGWKDGQGTASKDSNSFIHVLRIVSTTDKLLLGAMIASTQSLWGKLDEALVAGGSATVSVYSDTTTDTGANLEAYAPPEMTGAFPSAGQWVWIEWRKDRWYVRWHRHARKGTLYAALTNADYTTTTLDTGESVTTYAYALPAGVTLPAGTKVIVEPLLDNTWQVIEHDSVSFSVVGKTDASLSYDNTTGVTVSIWRRNASTNALEDSGSDLANVLPPAELGSGLIPAGAWVEVLVSGGKATIVEFPRWHWGTLGSTLSSGNSASVVLPSEAGVITSFDNLLPSGKTIESGAKVKIALNNGDGKWYVTCWYNAATLPNGTTTGDILKWNGTSWEPATPVTINVITSLQFSSGKLQYKDTEITVIAKGTEYAGWKDAGGQTDLATQTVLTDFQVDATNKLIQVKSRSLYVRPAAAESSWTTKHTGTECE